MSFFNLTRSLRSKLAFSASEVQWTIIRESAHKLSHRDFVPPRYSLFSTSSHRSNDGTVNDEEVAKFDRAAHRWWERVYGNENVPLHTMNVLRVPLIRDALIRQQALRSNTATDMKFDESPIPLRGLTILDVGCGGGILSEPLARLGAKVTGLDASEELIQVARSHADLDPVSRSSLTYVCSSVEEFCRANDDRFDGVVASEIVEHVDNLDSFVNACCSFVKPGGSIFFTTINKTWWSYASTVVAAERMFGIVPQGMHDWNKFVPPENLERILHQNDFMVRLVHGMTMNPLTLNWCWITNTCANYAMHAVKTTNEPTKETTQGLNENAMK